MSPVVSADLQAGSEKAAGLKSVDEPANALMPELRARWNDLVMSTDTPMPFITWDWYRVWLDAFCPLGKARLIAVFDGERLVAVLPYRIVEQRGGRGMRVLSSWVNTHSFRWGLICENGNYDAAEALTNQLAEIENWDVLSLNYAVSTSKTFQHFLNCLRQKDFLIESVPDMQSPVMHVPDDWDQFLTSMPKKRRESERRKLRKLERQGASCKFVTGTHAELDALLQDCWRISARTWKQEKGSAIAADETRKQFYEAIAKSEKGWICLALLYLGEKPIAFEFNLLFDGTLYSLKLGYDTDYARQSPGQALRFKLFEWCIQNNIRYFDFMGHRARYKDQYAASHVDHINVRVYSRTFRGRVYGVYWTGIRPILVRIKRKLWSVGKRMSGKTTVSQRGDQNVKSH